jgi:hypothetical protein
MSDTATATLPTVTSERSLLPDGGAEVAAAPTTDVKAPEVDAVVVTASDAQATANSDAVRKPEGTHDVAATVSPTSGTVSPQDAPPAAAVATVTSGPAEVTAVADAPQAVVAALPPGALANSQGKWANYDYSACPGHDVPKRYGMHFSE